MDDKVYSLAADHYLQIETQVANAETAMQHTLQQFGRHLDPQRIKAAVFRLRAHRFDQSRMVH